jgi:hypothetical protein
LAHETPTNYLIHQAVELPGLVVHSGIYAGYFTLHRSVQANGGIDILHWLELPVGDVEVTALVNAGAMDLINSSDAASATDNDCAHARRQIGRRLI